MEGGGEEEQAPFSPRPRGEKTVVVVVGTAPGNNAFSPFLSPVVGPRGSTCRCNRLAVAIALPGNGSTANSSETGGGFLSRRWAFPSSSSLPLSSTSPPRFSRRLWPSFAFSCFTMPLKRSISLEADSPEWSRKVRRASWFPALRSPTFEKPSRGSAAPGSVVSTFPVFPSAEDTSGTFVVDAVACNGVNRTSPPLLEMGSRCPAVASGHLSDRLGLSGAIRHAGNTFALASDAAFTESQTLA